MTKNLIRRAKDARDRFIDRVVMKRGAFRKSIHRLRQEENVYAYVAQDRNGLRFLYPPTDFTIGTALIERGEWQYDELDHFIAYIAEQAKGRDAWFFDIGANIGTQTVYAARSGVFSRVLAVEAIPSNHELLCANVLLNDCASVATCYNQALCAEAGQQTFVYNALNPGGSRRVNGAAGSGSVQLDVVSAADFVSERLRDHDSPDVLIFWIDVEGMEADVVSSLGAFCGDREAYFCVEYNQDLYDAVSGSAFRDYAESRATLFELTRDGIRPVDDLNVVERNTDIVFTSRARD
jgi:FkbM family methyltransferase